MNAPAESLRSRRIWSLWEMIERYGLRFGEMLRGLSELGRSYAHPSHDPTLNQIMDQARQRMLDECRATLILSGMEAVLPELDRLEVQIRITPGFRADITAAFKHLHDRVRDELRGEFFFRLDREDVPLYTATEPFGGGAGKRFPKAAEDIAEAAKCLALQRPTASVFHLMRAMEGAVKALGRKLKVAVDVEAETWYQIGLHIDGAIAKLPAKTAKEKRRKADLAMASANLSAVRIAQRNDVMHPKQTYTRAEAHDVYRTTRAFMTHLAGVI